MHFRTDGGGIFTPEEAAAFAVAHAYVKRWAHAERPICQCVSQKDGRPVGICGDQRDYAVLDGVHVRLRRVPIRLAYG